MRWNVSRKLILGFMATALLVGGVGFIGLTAIQEIVGDFDGEQKHFEHIFTATIELTNDVKRAEGHLMLFLELHGEIDRNNFFETHASLQERLVILDEKIKSPGSRILLDTIKSIESDLSRLGQSLIQSHDEGMAIDGEFQIYYYEDLLNTLHDTTSRMIDQGGKLAELERSLRNEGKKAAIRKAALIRRNTIIIIILLVVVALGLGYFISRSVTVPLTIIKNATVEIAKGDLDIKLEIPPRDEVGDLAASIQKMTEDLQKSRQNDEEKKRLEYQLQHEQRMESIGTLAGGIAHNFNNLLTGIMGNVSMVLVDIDSGNPHFDHLKNIENLVRSGVDLTGRLNGYARKRKLDVKPVNLNQLVEETSNIFRAARKQIKVHHNLDEKLLEVMADRGQIEQVMLNLYVNAGDAMPGGGNLFLETLNATDKDVSGVPFELSPGCYVLLRVRDTGVGMDEKTMQHIFDPFFTTKGLAEGTGLGLAYAYKIIKAHGGYIDVDSEKGHSTTLSIFLPTSEGKPREGQGLPGNNF